MHGNYNMIENELGIDIKLIVRDFGPKITSLSFRMIINKETAKEAAQEVWYEVIKSLPSFKGQSSVSTWIYTIAKRTILRYAKKERIITDSEIDDNFDKPEISYTGDENGRLNWVKEKCDFCLTAFCHCLNNDSRLIFLFKMVARLSYQEISGIMGTSEANIRKILSRSKEKIGNFMNDNCFLYNNDAGCKCRIKKELLKTDLQNEYKKYGKIVDLAGIYVRFEKWLPGKNFWEKYL